MTTFLILKRRLLLSLSVAMLVFQTLSAQVTVPFVINNNSDSPDEDIYIAIVGEDLSSPSNHIWVDPTNGNTLPMSQVYNTIKGPVYGGNQGPGLNAMYADCFRKLSQIPNRTINVPPIQGCRIYISKKEQLYFYFFGSSGAIKGYTAPNHTDPTDPNQGISYEIIELTNNEYGMFANTTRVDAYQYPIGMALYGSDGYFKKVGETASHEEIIEAFIANVPVEFQGCLDTESGKITAPSKTAAFADGTVGSMPVPGPYQDYMKPYVDAVWSKYRNEDLIFDSGDAGIWKGRVEGEQLIMTSLSDAFYGRRAIITRRPTTQEVLEGKGVLDNVVQDATTDLLVQAQLCAALNRHVVDTNTPNVGLQDWSDDSKYYQQSPCNHYAKFWHLQGISLDRLSYGFAYDDVWSYSSSVHTPVPTQAIINIGPYSATDCTPPIITPYSSVNGGTSEPNLTLSVNKGDEVTLSPQSSQSGDWQWSGPNGFSASSQPVTLPNIQSMQQGIYTATLFTSPECFTSTSFTIEVADPTSGCTQQVNSDFEVTLADESVGTSLTFIPKRPMVGAAICILYYSTSPAGAYPGYVVSAGSPYFIEIPEGQTIYYYYTYSIPEGGERNTFDNKQSFNQGDCSTYDPTYITIPSLLQAEDYSSMSGIEVESTRDIDGGENVGYIDANDWLEYKIQVPLTTTYMVEYRVASPNSNGKVILSLDGATLLTTPIPSTGGWQNWTTISSTVTLPEGQHTLRLTASPGAWNLNWLAFKENESNKGCTIPVNDDFSIAMEDNLITFVPIRPGVGTPTCILYYSQDVNGVYPGYLVQPNTPYEIDASPGENVNIYYTYSVPEGGERNTANNKVSYRVAGCNDTGSRNALSKTKQSFIQPKVYPNPARELIYLQGSPEQRVNLSIYNIHGQQVMYKTDHDTDDYLDITSLPNGRYFIQLLSDANADITAFIKIE